MKIEGIDERQDSIIGDGEGMNIDGTICISAASTRPEPENLGIMT